jgi:pentatricopeptide repeat protein
MDPYTDHQSGCESDVYLGSSLINMYAKCGSIEDAWRVFKLMHMHDVVVWSAIISGHVKCGQGQKALASYQQMQLEGVEPDPVIFMGVLNACGIVAALEVGRHVHEQIIQTGFMSDVLVSSSLIDMYAKCGSIEDAWRVFNEMPTCDVVTWHDCGTCELWVRTEGISIVPTNAKGKGGARPCHFCGSLECMCQHSGT